MVVNKDQRFLGTLTNGDLRRSILNGIKFSETIAECYYKNPTVLTDGSFTTEEAVDILNSERFNVIPVVDKNINITNYLTLESVKGIKKNKKKLEGVPVVIMAGGKGTRLEPFTKVLPKPLVPIHDKPIIEHIIESFTGVSCSNFYLTVNYKSKILKAFFEELQPKYKVHFIDEYNPLGTAGSLYMMRGKFSTPFFVTNCDIIVKADYISLYRFHQQGGYDITLVASDKEYIIPYGTCELDDNGHLSHINEKPKYDFLINTGLYVLNPDILDIIPNDKFYHITHLIEDAKKQGKKVGIYPINEDSWIDVGQWAEYRKAIKMM